MSAYVDSLLGSKKASLLMTTAFHDSLARSQMNKNTETFEEVMLLDLKQRYGSTESGRTGCLLQTLLQVSNDVLRV